MRRIDKKLVNKYASLKVKKAKRKRDAELQSDNKSK
jgi:hypothetical protein